MAMVVALTTPVPVGAITGLPVVLVGATTRLPVVLVGATTGLLVVLVGATTGVLAGGTTSLPSISTQTALLDDILACTQ